MPPLSRPSDRKTILLPPRQALVAAETDVLVVGGGPSGLGAALGAANAGARVVMAERYGFLGGTATAAMVTLWVSSHTSGVPVPRGSGQGGAIFFPDDHGPGEPVVAGAAARLIGRLVEGGGAVRPSLQTGYTMPFDPETFKLAALDLMDEAGVELLLHALASQVLASPDDGVVEGVVFETKSGPLAIKAKAVVDCTGDGDIAAWAGAPFEVGRPEDGLVQPVTLMFHIAEFRRAAFAAYAAEHPDQWRSVHGLWDLIRKAQQDGALELPREDILFFDTTREGELLVNSTRVTGVLATDAWDLTRAEMEGRRQMRQLVEFFRRYVPGFENSFVPASGAQVGVRETRRIVCDYSLTADDVLSARRFPDVIARGSYSVDVHNPKGKGTTLKKLPPGEAYDVPLRCLLPRGLQNLAVGGRCISGSHEAHSSYRVMPIAMATGQAAGVTAALSAATGRATRDVHPDEIQEELRRQGANLG